MSAKTKTCQRCKAIGLVWIQFGGKWSLAYPGTNLPHACLAPVRTSHVYGSRSYKYDGGCVTREN